ncbi:YybH family protein [Flavobacterium sp. WC2509]|uniref:YybH family protein n=1 Tax=Flavobacterium sp. WC2509 TaxID=3461406 RepID=UPI004043D904
MKNYIKFFIVLLVLNGCSPKSKTKNLAYVKLEIVKTEKDFEKLVAEKGLAEGFYQFADSIAVIKREHDTLIIGKNSIKNYYSNPKYQNKTVTWSPDDVTVSDAGDMASSYGKYIWTSKDSTGKTQISKGVFHTVWKKQKDGSWKYIWD